MKRHCFPTEQPPQIRTCTWTAALLKNNDKEEIVANRSVHENCLMAKAFFNTMRENQKYISHAYLSSRTRTRETKTRNNVGTIFVGMERGSMWTEILQDAFGHDTHELSIETIESRAQDTNEASTNEASTNAQLMQTL